GCGRVLRPHPVGVVSRLLLTSITHDVRRGVRRALRGHEQPGVTAMRQTFVIVGAGLAGAKAAEALRSEGYDGRIVLIGAESELPYERPPLSKDYLRGESSREKTHALPDNFYSDNDVELRLATTVDEV